MKTNSHYLIIALFCFLTCKQTIAQTAGTAVCMEVSNLVLTAPNQFTFDVNLRNTGTTTLKLRGYAGGINTTPGFANGGNISVSFLSRDSILNIIPAVTPNYTSTSHHFRFTTTNATVGNEVTLTPMLPYRLGTFKMTTTTSFNPMLGTGYDPFNPVAPATPMQILEESGKTDCEVNCVVNPTASSSDVYRLVGTGVTPTITYMLPVLTASYNGWGSCSSVPTSIKNPSTPVYKLSHNQSYSEFTLQSDNEFNKLSVRVIDISGKIVLETKNIAGNTYTFDFSKQASGLYILEILEGNHKEILKFLKN